MQSGETRDWRYPQRHGSGNRGKTAQQVAAQERSAERGIGGTMMAARPRKGLLGIPTSLQLGRIRRQIPCVASWF